MSTSLRDSEFAISSFHLAVWSSPHELQSTVFAENRSRWLMEDGLPRCASIHHRGCWVCLKAQRLTWERAEIRRKTHARRPPPYREHPGWWLLFELVFAVLEIIVSSL